MTFRTKLDYSDNRQIKQRERTNTILSGTTTFGVPFSALTSGPNMSATAQTSQYFGIVSSYSGNSATTVFAWSIPNVSAIDTSISALTPSNSGVSQNISAVFGSSSSTIIDGNLVNLTYSGVGATNLYPITMSEPTPGNYVGTVSTDFFIYSAQSLDFTGRTIWIDNTEILRTKKLIVSDNPIPGYVLTSNFEGEGTWQSISAVTSGTTFWLASTGTFAIVTESSGNLASGNYALAEGYGTIASGITSHAEGSLTRAIGTSSHAEGYLTTAKGNSSHAEGDSTSAIGTASHTEGYLTTAKGNYSHAEGWGNAATGISSHAEGVYSYAGDYAHAQNFNTQAIGNGSHAEGNNTIASGVSSHAEGIQTTAIGGPSHAEGQNTKAIGNASHAEGTDTIASGTSSHAEGNLTTAIGNSSHAEGKSTTAIGNFGPHAEGNGTIASGTASHAEGAFTKAIGNGSHAEGASTTASGQNSHAEGSQTTASGTTSHAEGISTTAKGDYSHAEGWSTTASGTASHAEGNGATAIGQASHAESYGLSYGQYSHAEGYGTIASGYTSHAEGLSTTAIGTVSHAEGQGTKAIGQFSHAGGWSTTASGNTSFVHGKDSIAGGDYTIVLGYNITGTTSYYTYVNSLNIGTVGSSAFANDIRIDANGNLTTNTSDERLKENITPITGALNIIKSLSGVNYQWKDRSAGGDNIKLGFIAQEVEKVEPKLVFTNKVDGYKGLHIDGIIPLLVEAIKELLNPNELILETQTIAAEDNNIELNYNGNKETAIGGGISIINGIDNEINAEFKLNTEGSWVTNNSLAPSSLIIPEYTPETSYDNYGKNGDITRDENYLYIKDNNTWKRSPLQTF